MNYDTFINLLFVRVPRADVTIALVALNILVFIGLAALSLSPLQIPSELLIRAGGNFALRVQDGEIWRLLTALFLHGGLLHVALNMFALYQAGQVVERLFGRLGFVVVYLGAGLLGNLASLWWRQGPVSIGASGAIFGVYGALLAYLTIQRGSVPVEVFREMRSGTLGFLGYSLFAGFAIAGIDNAAHLGGLFGGLILGAALAEPVQASRPVRWLALRTLAGLLAAGVVGGALWRATPDAAHELEVDTLYQQTVQRFALEDQELQREQGLLMEAVRTRRTSEAMALDNLERDLLPRWDRQVVQLSWRIAPPQREWQRRELIRYATARRDALKALLEGLQTRDAEAIERSRALQQEAESILVQMRLRKSVEEPER
ncbi:rhomboid family intramembrane serine protease [Zoogloea sp.]|uniref:rhomboid family intramembrane serine protease n=1 Tax=Zoogloea sp. TaxID=49181 RepID=UPI0035B2A65A